MQQQIEKQAGADLCQAQHSLSLLPANSGLATNLLGLLSQLWLEQEAWVSCLES